MVRVQHLLSLTESAGLSYRFPQLLTSARLWIFSRFSACEKYWHLGLCNMPLNRSIVFQLLLVILLAGDLGSHIFVAATALECTDGWFGSKGHYSCRGANKVTYDCKSCGRDDGLLPSGLDCIDQALKPVNGGGFWNCDGGMGPVANGPGTRQTICYHFINKSGGVATYYCRSPNKLQHCARESCRWNVTFITILLDIEYWTLQVDIIVVCLWGSCPKELLQETVMILV